MTVACFKIPVAGQHKLQAMAGKTASLPAVGLIMASAPMPVVGIVASCDRSPVCSRKAFRSALMVVSTLTVAFDDLVSET